MSQKNNPMNTGNARSVESPSCFEGAALSKFLFDDMAVWNNEEKDQDISSSLSTEERIRLGNRMCMFHKDILASWLRNAEMQKMYKKYDISRDEIGEYLSYFWWEKILHHIVNEMRWDYAKNKGHAYISTKFLSFIKKKNLWIEDLLKMVIVLKNKVVESFLDQEFKVIHQVIDAFDKTSTEVSKNYNDIIIKLLAEYTNAIDNSNIILKTDTHGIIIAVNDEFCRLSWYTKEELIWKPHNIVRHPDMPKKVFKDLWSTIQDKKIWKWTIKNRTKNGWFYWVKSTIVPILDETDQIVEYISIRTDITELKEAHKSLEEYTEALNDTNMVLKLDRFWKIMDVNDIFLQMSGYRKDELLGTSYIIWLIWSEADISGDNMIPLIQKETVEEVRDTIQRHATWKWVIKNKNKLGSLFWTSTNIVPIMDLHEEILEYVVIQNDITDLEIAQQKLEFSLSKQRELDMKKDEFLNIASHELRTPMTSIKWYTSMILDGDAGEINEEVKSYLSQVYKSSQRLLNLINDMLDISKIESWKQELLMQATDMASLLKETATEVKSLFEKKRQNFIISIDFEKFEYTTDENKLKQVLLNLLWNANKFTPEWWTIRFDCQKIGEEIVICVEDDGIGIEKQHFQKIFEKFWQVKTSLTRDINGTWLGLPIVKAIIEQMNGHIDMESEIGKGSRFSIYLPINQI